MRGLCYDSVRVIIMGRVCLISQHMLSGLLFVIYEYFFSLILPRVIFGSLPLAPSPLSCWSRTKIYIQISAKVTISCIRATRSRCNAPAKKKEPSLGLKRNKSCEWQTKKPHRHSGNSLLTLIFPTFRKAFQTCDAPTFRTWSLTTPGLNLFSSWFALQTLFLGSTFNTHPTWIRLRKERQLFSNLKTSTKTHSYTLRRRWQNGCCVDAGLFPSYLSAP